MAVAPTVGAWEVADVRLLPRDPATMPPETDRLHVTFGNGLWIDVEVSHYGLISGIIQDFEGGRRFRLWVESGQRNRSEGRLVDWVAGHTRPLGDGTLEWLLSDEWNHPDADWRTGEFMALLALRHLCTLMDISA